MGLLEEISEVRDVRPGRKIFVRKFIIGDNTRPTGFNVVAVHGTNGTQAQYEKMIMAMGEIEQLDKEKCIVFWVYDMAGCGNSPEVNTDDYKDPSDAYSNEESALDLKAIVKDMVDTTQPTYFVGHSYGPTIIIEMLNDPDFELENLQGMVFISSAFREGPLPLKDGGPLVTKYLPLCVLECLKPMLTRSFISAAFHAETDPAVVELARKHCTDDNLKVSTSYLQQHKWTNIRLAQAAKDIPVLIIHGAEDNLIPPGCGQHISNILARTKLQYVERAGHMVMMEKPQEVAKLVLDFLTQIECVYLVRDGFPPMS